MSRTKQDAKSGKQQFSESREWSPSNSSKTLEHTTEKHAPRLGKRESSLIDNKFTVFIIFNISLLVAVLAYVYHLHRLEVDVVTPLDAPKLVVQRGLQVPERYWGTYRSHTYFGLKNRHPDPINFGLMWFNQKPRGNSLLIRHWCSQRDGLQHYTWTRHDGVNFGEQTIIDGDLNLTLSFVKRNSAGNGGDWTARIDVNQINAEGSKPEPMSLFFYAMANLRTHNLTLDLADKTRVQSIRGSSPEVGRWRLKFYSNAGGIGREPLAYNYLSTVVPAPDEIVDIVQKNVLAVKKKGHPVKLFFVQGKVFAPEDFDKKPNFVMSQVTVVPPYTMEVVFENTAGDEKRSSESELKGSIYDNEIALFRDQFDTRFERIFSLNGKYKAADINAAKAALSNMLGTIGYFYGQSLVRGPNNREAVLYWPAALYTGVPSRSFFPRGFLWDEGFHNLLIMQWDVDISKDILSHWLDLLNKNGWIPREQILGEEARALVPNEFVVQKSSNANPPVLFVAFKELLKMMNEGQIPEDKLFFEKAYPRLEAIYEYFQREQRGPTATTYRWRGRDAEIRTELNPKTLASGLDDYPRASHPTDDERHLDLRCWVALMADVLTDIGKKIGLPESRYASYQETFRILTDNSDLNKYHWSDRGQYSDFGLHTDDVILVNQKQKPGEPPLPMVRFTLKQPSLRFVNQFGYVSLFPFLFCYLNPDSPMLGHVLTQLSDPTHLWTAYGLRSLSKASKLYSARNTEHDPPYWRGNIWINVNFLAVRALKHYSKIMGPHQKMANRLHHELHKNIVRNIVTQYHKSGFIWENYRDDSGKGSGSHPFTGWSALLVLLMSEKY